MIRWALLFLGVQNARIIRVSKKGFTQKSECKKKITEKHVVYKSEFKIKAVEQYIDGWKPNEIFEEVQIDPNYFIKNYCQSCLKRWKKKYQEEGKLSLNLSQTGRKATGRPKSINTDDMTVEEMKALLEIQYEVIDMLKQRRALTKKK